MWRCRATAQYRWNLQGIVTTVPLWVFSNKRSGEIAEAAAGRRAAAAESGRLAASTSMQAVVVRAANEWQDKVVQRRAVDRQPEAVHAFKQGDWVVHRHFGNRRPTKLSPLWIGPYQVLNQASNSMYRLQDPADLKEHLSSCHIDELDEYRTVACVTDGPHPVH
jgi:hypothetical protein